LNCDRPLDRGLSRVYASAMLSKLIRRLSGFAAPSVADEAARIEAQLKPPPWDQDVATLVPVIVPRECAEQWPGPIVPIADLPFAGAWALIPKPNLFVYVSHEQASYWAGEGVDWREEAMLNLARIASSARFGRKCDASGRPFVVALLTDDAIGPSHLVLPRLFEDELGPDYRVAIPERTCAIAFRAALDDEEERVVAAMIDGCLRQGTEPMNPNRFDPADFWILGDPRPPSVAGDL
jgi:hypothetical protein